MKNRKKLIPMQKINGVSKLKKILSKLYQIIKPLNSIK